MLIQSLLQFFMALALSSLVGISSYFCLRKPYTELLALPVVSLTLTLFGLPVVFFFYFPPIFEFLLELPTVIRLYIFAFPQLQLLKLLPPLFIGLCCVGTYAEKSVYSPEETWWNNFFKMLALSINSAFLCVVFLLGAYQLFNINFLPKQDYPTIGFATGCSLGALWSPSLTAVFLWVLRASEARSGVDQHLKFSDNRLA